MASFGDKATGEPEGSHYSALERRVLEFLSVPAAPEVPEGSASSVQIFRAGDKYYAWLVFTWAVRAVAIFVALMIVSVGLLPPLREAPRWGQAALSAILIMAWSIFTFTTIITFLARRLNFRLRWYIVTDRSLRIRRGVFAVEELTMTYRNIQEIRVTAGPLQHALGLANVEVHAAGGGRDAKGHGSGHVGRLEGLANANEIRDLMLDRLRHYRDAGLGDSPPLEPAHAQDELDLSAARHVLEEVRALRRALTSRSG